MALKYQKEIDQFFDSICEDWMDENEKSELKIAIESATGITDEKLNLDIQTGVDNGMPADAQIKMAIAMLNKEEKNG